MRALAARQFGQSTRVYAGAPDVTGGLLPLPLPRMVRRSSSELDWFRAASGSCCIAIGRATARSSEVHSMLPSLCGHWSRPKPPHTRHRIKALQGRLWVVWAPRSPDQLGDFHGRPKTSVVASTEQPSVCDMLNFWQAPKLLRRGGAAECPSGLWRSTQPAAGC